MKLTRDAEFKLLWAQRGRCPRCGAKLQLDHVRDDNYSLLRRRRFGGPVLACRYCPRGLTEMKRTTSAYKR